MGQQVSKEVESEQQDLESREEQLKQTEERIRKQEEELEEVSRYISHVYVARPSGRGIYKTALHAILLGPSWEHATQNNSCM